MTEGAQLTIEYKTKERIVATQQTYQENRMLLCIKKQIIRKLKMCYRKRVCCTYFVVKQVIIYVEQDVHVHIAGKGVYANANIHMRPT